MKKIIIILIAPILITVSASAQSAGDYRSIGNGNWNDATKWETYNGSSWVSTTNYPGQRPGTGAVTIMVETEIEITASIPNPVASLLIDIYLEQDESQALIIAKGNLVFNSETAVSFNVLGDVVILGELRINNQNGAKTHQLAIGRNFEFGTPKVWDYYCHCYLDLAVFQTINNDDKLGVIFNSNGQYGMISCPEGNGISFQDITLNGTGVHVNTNIAIAGIATFINGYFKPGLKSFTNGMDVIGEFDIGFYDGATVSGASDVSYIDGTASKFGVEPFTFPVGSGGFYAPLTISGIVQPEKFYAAYHRNTDLTPRTITDPELFSSSNCESWSLIRDIYNPVNPSIDVTVGWKSATRCGSSSYISNVADVVLVYVGEYNNWSHGGTATGTITNGSVTWSGYNNLNDWGSLTLGNVGTDCRTPFGLNSTNITTNTATVSWSAVPGAEGYNVEYKANGGNTWINAATTTSLSANLTGLNPGTTYSLRVGANCGSGLSSYRIIQFTTLNDCGLPSGLTATNITSNSATLSWAPAANAIYYVLEYEASSSWYLIAAGITSLSYQFTNLFPSYLYKWRVIGVCPSGAWDYVQSSFTTLATYCNDVYETNNTSTQAKAISLGNTTSAGISSTTDIDWFKVTTSNNSNTNLDVRLSNLLADYDLYVYNKNLQLLRSSVTTGTSNEVVIYNSNARKATYFIKVLGKNGAYNASQCYNLLANAFSGGVTASRVSDPVNEIPGDENNHLLYPNPASEFVYVGFNSTIEGPVNVQLFNTSGQLTKQVAIKITKGYNQVKISVNDVKSGMYLLRINKGELTIMRRFVKAE